MVLEHALILPKDSKSQKTELGKMPKSIQLIKVNFSVGLYSAGEAYLRPLPETLRIVFLGLYVVVFLLGVTGNCLVIRECLCTQKRKRVSALFVGSFAISNVTIASLCMPFTVVTNLVYWEFPRYLCPTVSFIQLLVVTQRMCALVALTLHRYRSIVHSFAKRMTKQKGAIITLLFSVLSAFFALPALFQNKSIYIVISSGIYGLCVEAWYSIPLRNLYSVAIFIVQFLIPMIILSVAHARVLRKIFRREVPGERIQTRDKRLQVSRKKVRVFTIE